MMEQIETVGVMVAHPDDETLWAGGLLLLHPEWHCFTAAACRASDIDRAPKFHRALAHYGAEGRLADMDDGPEQTPLAERQVQDIVLALLGDRQFDLLLTHGPWGEYTWHERHVEVSRAVLSLWSTGQLRARQLWLFAYEDGERRYPPRAREDADLRLPLPEPVWERKHDIICETYGFASDSWEARATPRIEAFRQVTSPAAALAWHNI